jgi:hypothetical protein
MSYRDSVNLYEYALSNPTTFFDAYGTGVFQSIVERFRKLFGGSISDAFFDALDCWCILADVWDLASPDPVAEVADCVCNAKKPKGSGLIDE